MTLTAEDRFEILDLVARVNNAASERNVDDYLALFTPDGAIEGDEGSYSGHALRTNLASIWAAEGTAKRHLALNVAIAGSGNRAEVTYVLVILEVERSPTIVTTASITQQVRKDDRWRVALHRIAVDSGSNQAIPLQS